MRISNENLGALKNKGITVPEYDRSGLKAKIAHIGLGHFHRSHFLTYLDELLSAGLYEGGVFEIDTLPVSPDFIKGLKAQDWMYSVLSLSPDGTRDLRINGPVVGYANGAADPEKVLEILSSPCVDLITLTITEKGYCYRDDIASLDFDNPAIIHDLDSDTPSTAIGFLAAALQMRCKSNHPVTIMSCDNVPENGKMLRKCIAQFCKRKYPEIMEWIESSVAFPCTMVDRITPGTTDEDIIFLKQNFDVDDSCPVHAEAFRQWVIENTFCTPVPDFSRVGALVVDDVRPYELMKIRLLNGSHSALSYPAYMMGIKMVHEAAGNPLIRKFIREMYMEEITRTLPPVPGVDIPLYKDELIERFSNPYIADTILRLASDGSKKISNAILRPLEEGLRNGCEMRAVLLALSIWEYFFIAKDANGEGMPIDDPKKNELEPLAMNPEAFLIHAGLAPDVLPPALSVVENFLDALRKSGVEAVLRDFVSI